MPAAVIFGCSGPQLTDAERDFFRTVDPLGFILFARNCGEPEGLRALVAELRACVGRSTAPVLIDQEGGRVARLGPPHWRPAPAQGVFARLHDADSATARRAAQINARLIAAELHDLGITVDCLPVLDLPQPDAHGIIGDRALGRDVGTIATLGRAVCEGLLEGGVLPVIKHIPGHGRARADSHVSLPVVDEPREVLHMSDFLPFAALADAPLAMTAHVVYSAYDAGRPATLSPIVIEEAIRSFIGFDGFLLSDDLSMGALEGGLGARAKAALAAGCDAVLHCNGEIAEMEEVARACPPLGGAAVLRWARAEAMIGKKTSIDFNELREEVESFVRQFK